MIQDHKHIIYLFIPRVFFLKKLVRIESGLKKVPLGAQYLFEITK